MSKLFLDIVRDLVYNIYGKIENKTFGMDSKMKTTRIFLICVIAFTSLDNEIKAYDYTIIDLGTLGGDYSIAHSLNNSGQVVGESRNINGDIHAFIWDKDQGIFDLGSLGDHSVAYGINGFGQVVGESSGYAFLWDNVNNMQSIGVGEARDINNNGKIVGSANNLAFIWDSDSGMTSLGTLGGDISFSYGTNESDYIVGMSSIENGDYRAFNCDHNLSLYNLGTLGGRHSHARDINNLNQVVGYSYSDHGEQAFIWDSSNKMIELGSIDNNFSWANAINDYSKVVGAYNPFVHTYHAFIWDKDNGMIDLNDLVDLNSNWQYLAFANNLNNQGQIVGYGISSNGEYHAFLLTPIPEPSSILFICMGGLIIKKTRCAKLVSI